MAFPTTLDDLDASRGTSTQALNSPSHVTHHTNEDTLIEALQAKIGIDSSAAATSLDYILKNTTGGHDHDGTDSKKVVVTNVDITGISASQLVRVNAGATALEGLTAPGGDLVGTTAVQTLTNKTLTSPAGIVKGDVGLGNVDNTSDATKDAATATLTNKTLTSPAINTPTITTPTVRNWDGWVDANETWTFSSADGPTGIITIPTDGTTKYSVGMRIKLTQTTVKYFIITAIAATTMTVYGGTDYTLANAAISANYYSSVKVPFGFPASPTKWTEELSSVSDVSQAVPTTNTWYNLGSLSITIPIGLWRVEYFINPWNQPNAAASMSLTLSTANNSESDVDFTSQIYSNTSVYTIVMQSKAKILSLAAKTIYYSNAKTDSGGSGVTIAFRNSAAKMFIRAICAYL